MTTEFKMPDPFAYFQWFDGKPVWDECCVCKDAVYPIDDEYATTSMPIYTSNDMRAVIEHIANHVEDKFDLAREEFVVGAEIRKLLEQVK